MEHDEVEVQQIGESYDVDAESEASMEWDCFADANYDIICHVDQVDSNHWADLDHMDCSIPDEFLIGDVGQEIYVQNIINKNSSSIMSTFWSPFWKSAPVRQESSEYLSASSSTDYFTCSDSEEEYEENESQYINQTLKATEMELNVDLVSDVDESSVAITALAQTSNIQRCHVKDEEDSLANELQLFEETPKKEDDEISSIESFHIDTDFSELESLITRQHDTSGNPYCLVDITESDSQNDMAVAKPSWLEIYKKEDGGEIITRESDSKNVERLVESFESKTKTSGKCCDTKAASRCRYKKEQEVVIGHWEQSSTDKQELNDLPHAKQTTTDEILVDISGRMSQRVVYESYKELGNQSCDNSQPVKNQTTIHSETATKKSVQSQMNGTLNDKQKFDEDNEIRKKEVILKEMESDHAAKELVLRLTSEARNELQNIVYEEAQDRQKLDCSTNIPQLCEINEERCRNNKLLPTSAQQIKKESVKIQTKSDSTHNKKEMSHANGKKCVQEEKRNYELASIEIPNARINLIKNESIVTRSFLHNSEPAKSVCNIKQSNKQTKSNNESYENSERSGKQNLEELDKKDNPVFNGQHSEKQQKSPCCNDPLYNQTGNIFHNECPQKQGRHLCISDHEKNYKQTRILYDTISSGEQIPSNIDYFYETERLRNSEYSDKQPPCNKEGPYKQTRILFNNERFDKQPLRDSENSEQTQRNTDRSSKQIRVLPNSELSNTETITESQFCGVKTVHEPKSQNTKAKKRPRIKYSSRPLPTEKLENISDDERMKIKTTNGEKTGNDAYFTEILCKTAGQAQERGKSRNNAYLTESPCTINIGMNDQERDYIENSGNEAHYTDKCCKATLKAQNNDTDYIETSQNDPNLIDTSCTSAFQTEERKRDVRLFKFEKEGNTENVSPMSTCKTVMHTPKSSEVRDRKQRIASGKDSKIGPKVPPKPNHRSIQQLDSRMENKPMTKESKHMEEQPSTPAASGENCGCIIQKTDESKTSVSKKNDAIIIERISQTTHKVTPCSSTGSVQEIDLTTSVDHKEKTVKFECKSGDKIINVTYTHEVNTRGGRTSKDKKPLRVQLLEKPLKADLSQDRYFKLVTGKPLLMEKDDTGISRDCKTGAEKDNQYFKCGHLKVKYRQEPTGDKKIVEEKQKLKRQKFTQPQQPDQVKHSNKVNFNINPNKLRSDIHRTRLDESYDHVIKILAIRLISAARIELSREYLEQELEKLTSLRKRSTKSAHNKGDAPLQKCSPPCRPPILKWRRRNCVLKTPFVDMTGQSHQQKVKFNIPSGNIVDGMQPNTRNNNSCQCFMKNYFSKRKYKSIE